MVKMAAIEGNKKKTFDLCVSLTFLCLMLFQVHLTVGHVARPLTRVLRSTSPVVYETTATLSPNSPMYGPRVPLLVTLSEHLKVGSVIRIHGFVPKDSKVFQINLCHDCDRGPMHMHLSVRFVEHVVVRNSYEQGQWKIEERDSPLGNFPFNLNQEFVLVIEVKEKGYYISVDGEHAWAFAHRVPFTTVEEFEIVNGPVLIWKIDYTDVEHLGEGSGSVSTTNMDARNKYQLNGDITQGMTIHLNPSSDSDVFETFLLDLRCECTPQNSSSVSESFHPPQIID